MNIKTAAMHNIAGELVKWLNHAQATGLNVIFNKIIISSFIRPSEFQGKIIVNKKRVNKKENDGQHDQNNQINVIIQFFL
jgi:hypothetical protein